MGLNSLVASKILKRLQILVFDYAGTLTMDAAVIPDAAKNALREIYQRKLALLGIVSGRDLSFLKQANKAVNGSFSFLVAENGAVSYFEGSDESLIKGRDWSKLARIVFSNVDFHIQFAEIIASSKRENSEKIGEILSRSDLESKLALNKDSIMVCPPNVDKGSGVAEAVRHYGETRDVFLTCFGDGENDVPLFGPADYRVAVSNGVNQLKTIADTVTSKPGGLGVEEYLRSNFLASY